MKKGINLWSIEWPSILKNFSNREIARKIREIGYEGVELVFDDEFFDPTVRLREAFESLREDFESEHLEIPSVATRVFWKYNLGSDDEKIRKKGIEYGKAGVKMASIVGASSLLVVPGIASPEIPYETLYQNAVESVREIAEFAKDHGVTIAVENVWNKFLYSPLEFKNFIEDTGMSNVKAYIDIANLLAISYPENWIHTLSRSISNIHVKDFDVNIGNINGFRNLLKGSVNWRKTMEALRSIGYDGYLIVECPIEFDPSIKSPTALDIFKNAFENCRALEKIIGEV
jgi:hexulose-6-phosphate isomerase